RLELQAAYRILREAKALVFPSKWNEPFGRTAVEAFAAGVPVIAAKQGGLTELVDEGVNGMLFDPFAKNNLSESLVLFESKYTVSFRKNARRTFERKFTREVNYQQLMGIYSQILNT